MYKLIEFDNYNQIDDNFEVTLDGTRIIGWQNGVAIGENKKLVSSKYYIGRGGVINVVGRNQDQTVEISKEINIVQEIYQPAPEEDYFDFDELTGTIVGYHGPKDVSIPSTIDGVSVIRIGENAFNGMEITSVNIPGSVQSIEAYAFTNNLLETVSIPPVNKIGVGAFSNNNISFVTLSDSDNTEILGSAFSDNQITMLSIPSGVKLISDNAFENNLIETLLLNDGVEVIKKFAFKNNKIRTLVLPNSLIEIGQEAFSTNEIDNLTLPMNVTTWGSSVFSNNKLTTFSVPVNPDTGELIMTSIPDGMFESNLITEVNIPQGITSIGFSSFRSNMITSVGLASGVVKIYADAFANNQINSLVLPNTVDYLGIGAFRNNLIETLVLSNNLYLIEDQAFMNNRLTALPTNMPLSQLTIGTEAFKDNLITIFDDSAVNSLNVYPRAFANNLISSVKISSAISTLNGTFEGNQVSSINLISMVNCRINTNAFGEYSSSFESMAGTPNGMDPEIYDLEQGEYVYSGGWTKVEV